MPRGERVIVSRTLSVTLSAKLTVPCQQLKKGRETVPITGTQAINRDLNKRFHWHWHTDSG